MAKLSDADRLARLFGILDYLADVDRATVGELAARFGGSPRSLYDDLVAAWLAEDPRHTGVFPLRLHVEYFEKGDPDYRPVGARQVWVTGRPGSPAARRRLSRPGADRTRR